MHKVKCFLKSLLMVQDSERYWRVTPPARRALERMLNGSDAALGLSWSVLRDAPLESRHGGPLCQGTREVTLSGGSRRAVLDVLQVLNPSILVILSKSRDGHFRAWQILTSCDLVRLCLPTCPRIFFGSLKVADRPSCLESLRRKKKTAIFVLYH